jgi:hypothetical protein
MERELVEGDICSYGVHSFCTRRGLREGLGCKPEYPFRDEMAQRVAPWIKNNFSILDKIKTSRPPGQPFSPLTSWGLLSLADRFVGPEEYVSNGELIVAALRAGARAIQFKDGPNALFNLQWHGLGCSLEKPSDPSSTFVYFIQAGGRGGPIKIGRARDVFQRLNQLQTGSPEELEILAVLAGAAVDLEKHLHQRFANSHLRGEWFKPSRELLALIESARKP